MKARRRPPPTASDADQNPDNALGNQLGTFYLNGRWNQEAPREAGKAKTYKAVKKMVEMRRKHPDLTPDHFAQMAATFGVLDAFPWSSTHAQSLSRGAWLGSQNWLEVGCATGAERAVMTGANQYIPNPVGDSGGQRRDRRVGSVGHRAPAPGERP